MIYITVNGKMVELSTKLRTVRKLEKRFNLNGDQIFASLGDSMVDERVDILAIAAGKDDDPAFKDDLLDTYDSGDMLLAVTELVTKMYFSGTPEQNAVKLAKFPADEKQKNSIRELLGLPEAPVSTGKPSSKMLTP